MHRLPSSPETVVASVKEGILTGRYLPGQRLLEASLCREFNLSRGPVREAMTRLAAEGVVADGPGRGLYIRALRRREALDVLQVLQVLIELAVRLAIVRCRYEPDRITLKEAYERLVSRIGMQDSVLLSIERTRFYETLFEITGNRELVRAHPTVASQILRAQVYPYLSPQDRQSQYADYEPLYTAIRNGEVGTAIRIVRTHLQRSVKHANDLPDEAFADEIRPNSRMGPRA